jgi:hypothetical protein
VASVTGEFRGFVFFEENTMDVIGAEEYRRRLENLLRDLEDQRRLCMMDENMYERTILELVQEVKDIDKKLNAGVFANAEDIKKMRSRKSYIYELLLHYGEASREKGEKKANIARRIENISQAMKSLDEKLLSGQSTEQENRKGRRLKLNRNENEQLNDRIVKKVRELVYKGKATQRQAFEILAEESRKSKKLFGFALTAKQIEGRFNRNKKKVPD